MAGPIDMDMLQQMLFAEIEAERAADPGRYSDKYTRPPMYQPVPPTHSVVLPQKSIPNQPLQIVMSEKQLREKLQRDMEGEREREKKWKKKQKSGKGKKPQPPSNEGLARQIAKEFPAEEEAGSGGGEGGGVLIPPVRAQDSLRPYRAMESSYAYPSGNIPDPNQILEFFAQRDAQARQQRQMRQEQHMALLAQMLGR